jgi:L-iditol 2-dehydrogenase
VVVPTRILYRLPKEVSFEEATLVEPLSVAQHGVKGSMLPTDKSSIVVGTGMVGLLTIGSLTSFGIPLILAVDVDDEKLALAKQFGATHTCNPSKQDPVELARSLTEGRGVDLALEVVGIENSFLTAVGSVRKGRGVSLIGNVSPKVTMPLQIVVTHELTLQGSCASSGEYGSALSLIKNRLVPVGKLISKTVPLDEAGMWFRKLYAGEDKLLKVVVKP